jgi:hypothetical protein
MKEAIRTLELNVGAYPKSANPWDSLAEAVRGGPGEEECRERRGWLGCGTEAGSFPLPPKTFDDASMEAGS